MIDCLNQNNISVPVIHAQGDSRYQYAELLDGLAQRPASVPDWVGVITCCSNDALDDAPLPRQLTNNGIRFCNPAAHVTNWKNALKPRLIADAIDQTNTPYVLVLDALDVALNGHFIRAIPGYLDYHSAVLFGATRSNSPDIIIDEIPDRDRRGAFRYLNAGTSFGSKEAMATFYRLVADAADELDDCEREQPLVRAVFHHCQNWVEFDWRCAVFQTLGRAQAECDAEVFRFS